VILSNLDFQVIAYAAEYVILGLCATTELAMRAAYADTADISTAGIC